VGIDFSLVRYFTILRFSDGGIVAVYYAAGSTFCFVVVVVLVGVGDQAYSQWSVNGATYLF
jgi:hypothetical protein